MKVQKVTPKDISYDIALMMQENDYTSLPVTDENDKLVGIITLKDIEHKDTSFLVEEDSVTLSTKAIAKILEGEIFGKGEDLNSYDRVKIVTTKEQAQKSIGVVLIDGYNKELIDNVSGKLIIVCDYKNEKIESEKPVVATKCGLFRASKLLSKCRLIEDIMVKNVIRFNEDDYLDVVNEDVKSMRFRCFPVIDNDQKVVGMLTRANLLNYTKKKVVLVDHNESTQSLSGLDQAEIEAIIDHHRLGDVQTAAPLFMRSEPVGSCNTIIAALFKENGLVPPKPIAGAMLCAILSDTVLFKSPTCTKKDRDTALYLSEIVGENIDKIGNDLFTAGSTIAKEGPKAMLQKDFKEFAINGKRVGVGQVTIWDIDLVKNQKDELIKIMNTYVDDKGFDLFLFMETSIKEEGTLLLCAGDYKGVIERGFKKTIEGNEIYLEGVMSRKKQIIPGVTLGTV